MRIASAPAYYNWQTAEQLRQLLEECHFGSIALEPCGLFTGANADAMAAVADVHEIPEQILDTTIFELESQPPPDCLGAARFMFATCRKREVTSGI